jgi:hypothetical protein
MQLVKKSIAVAAVVGVLALAPKATAGFTPPSNITPFLPASNSVTVNKIATVGSYSIYACSMGGTVAVPTSYSLGLVQVIASSNCSWTKFKAATISADSINNPTVVTQAQNWWNANINNPYYGPLVAAAKAAAAKSPVGIAAPKAAAVGGTALPRRR